MNTVHRILVGSALGIAAASTAPADTISSTATFGPTTGSTYTLTLGKFDSRLGTLSSVQLYFQAIETFYVFTVQNNGEDDQTWDLSVSTNLVRTFTNSATAADKYTGENLQVFDTNEGTASGNCTAAGTCIGTQSTAAGAISPNYGPFSVANTDDMFGLRTGVGLAGVTGVRMTGTAIANYQAAGGGTFSLSGTTRNTVVFDVPGQSTEALNLIYSYSYLAEVDYMYTAAPATPEPAGLVVCGLGLLAIRLTACRR